MKTKFTLSSKQTKLRSLGLGLFTAGAFLLAPNQDAFSQQCKMMIDVDFNQWKNNQVYTIANAKSDFGNMKPWSASTYRGIGAPGANDSYITKTPQTTKIVNGTLRAHYTKKAVGARTGGFAFDPYFDGVEEAYLEYKLKFDKDFFWAGGGKLPGLGGSTRGIGKEGEGRGAMPSGGKYNDDGFSGRLMWRRNTNGPCGHKTNPYLILYSYFAVKEKGGARPNNSNAVWGDAWKLFSNLKADKWYTIRQYMKLNTPGKGNGTVTIWVDGKEVWKNTKMNIRKSGKSNLKINALIMNTYRGGGNTCFWHSPRDEYAFFDDFKVWTGCANPPDNSNKAPNVAMTSPANNANFTLGQTINLGATASDDDGSIKKVNFKVNELYHSQDLVGPSYTGTFTPTEPGTYILSARAFDNKDAATEVAVTITVSEPKGPFSGTPMIIPGTLEMENYDVGGPDVSYKDTHTENKGAVYRNDGVDIESMGSNEYAVGWISTGEWLEYTVDVASEGSYDLTIFYSANTTDSKIGVSMDGDDVFTGMALPTTGGYDKYSTVEKNNVNLSAGEQVLRFNVEKNGFNIDKIVFAPSTVTASNEIIATESIVIYPNPNETGIFNLTQSTKWKLLSVQGTKLASGESKQIDISNMNKGIYIVQFPNGVTQRVLVR